MDDDGHAGPNGCGGGATAPKKIQAGINGANAGDTVLVCPGDYRGAARPVQGNRDSPTGICTTQQQP